MSKIIISCDEGYIIILSLYLQFIGSSVPGDVSNQSTLSFDDYKKKKREDQNLKRQLCMPNGHVHPRKAQQMT